MLRRETKLSTRREVEPSEINETRECLGPLGRSDAYRPCISAALRKRNGESTCLKDRKEVFQQV